MASKHYSTGHRDCAGDMICRHDRVYTPNGQAAVLWVGRKWTLRYNGGAVEGLNRYDAAQLRRQAR